MSVCGVELDGANDDLVELALAHHELGVDAVAVLHDGVDDLDPGRARELAQLGQTLLDVARAPLARPTFRRPRRGWRGRPWLRPC